MKFEIVPMKLEDANAFVLEHHRHHPPVVGHKFSIGVVDVEQRVRGVAIIGRPNARGLDDGWTLEITRVATDGCKDACSSLYGAARRAVFAQGYRRLVTYTLKSEGGASLRASGYHVVGEVTGRTWSTPSRPRVETSEAQLQDKFRWEVERTQ